MIRNDILFMKMFTIRLNHFSKFQSQLNITRYQLIKIN